MTLKSSLFRLVVVVLSIVVSLTQSNPLPPPSFFFTDEEPAPVNTDIGIDYNHKREKGQNIASFVEKHKDVLHMIGGDMQPRAKSKLVVKPGQTHIRTDSHPPDERPTPGAYQSDIILTDDQRELIVNSLKVTEDAVQPPSSDDNGNNINNNNNWNNNNWTGRKKRGLDTKGTALTGNYWPMAIVPVVFDVESEKIETIINAIVHYSVNTCLMFVLYNEDVGYALGHHSHLVFRDDLSGCWSYVGRVSEDNQTVSIGQDCDKFGTILHEIGHAIGLHHEQSRPDRDFFITVEYDEIPMDKRGQFLRYSKDVVTTFEGEYDLNSIMHYGAYAFTKNGEYTLKTLKPEYQDVIGQREGLSEGDIAAVTEMYECAKAFTWY